MTSPLDQQSRTQLPKGVRDLFGTFARTMREIESSMRESFRQWGYADVITTSLEFAENMSRGLGESSRDSLLKLVDVEGHVLALRGDFTSGIARLVSSRFSPTAFPLRISYSGSVFRRIRPLLGQDREFHQAGVELIGTDGVASDVEVLVLAARILEDLRLTGFRIAVGHTGYFRALLEDTGLPNRVQEELRVAVGNRDAQELVALGQFHGLNEEACLRLAALPDLCGPASCLDRARASSPNDSAREALDHLARIFEALKAWDLEDHFLVDLGEVRGFAYYTGIHFEGFLPQLGTAVLSGGRYDDLMSKFGPAAPAVGMAFALERIALVLSEAPKSTDLIFIMEADRIQDTRAKHLATALRDRGFAAIIGEASQLERACRLTVDEQGVFQGIHPVNGRSLRLTAADLSDLDGEGTSS